MEQRIRRLELYRMVTSYQNSFVAKITNILQQNDGMMIGFLTLFTCIMLLL